MPNYESPIGKKQFKQTTREFNVPDESGFVPQQVRPRQDPMPVFDENEMRQFEDNMHPSPPQMREVNNVEQQILEAKRAKREGKERLSDGARRRIEMLVGMTRLTKDVEIDGQLYRLQTLKSRELREALVATSEFDGSIQLVFETRKQLLARSLIVVAGMEIGQFLSSDDLQTKLDFIEEMDHSLLLRLYNEYVILANDAQDKYSLKTEEQVKEVIEDLKK